MLTLQDVMTRDVATLAPDQSLRDALSLFAARHVSGAPVVEGGRVVGVLSQSDLIAFLADPPAEPDLPDPVDAEDEPDVEALLDGERPSWAAADDEEEATSAFFTHLWDGGGAEVADRFADGAPRRGAPVPDLLARHTVGEAMTHAAFSLSPTAELTMAADYMRTVGVHRILVLDHGKLVGIVSTSDVARAAADGLMLRRTFVFQR